MPGETVYLGEKLMKNSIITLVVAFLFTANVFGQSDQVKTDLAKAFKKFDVVKLNASVELTKVKAHQNIKIHTDGRDFEITLVEHDLRSADYKQSGQTTKGEIEIPKAANTTYKGKVNGDSTSIVRLALNSKKVEGLILTGNNRYYIEPAGNYSSKAAAEDFLVYKQEVYSIRKRSPVR